MDKLTAVDAEDPRLTVLINAELMAAPIGTCIAETDPTWREYCEKLLAELDKADPLRVCPWCKGLGRIEKPCDYKFIESNRCAECGHGGHWEPCSCDATARLFPAQERPKPNG